MAPTPELVLHTFKRGPFWNFSYLLGVPGGDAIVIDPAWDAAAILAAAAANQMRIAAIALTHAHHDHLNGLATLVAATAAPVYLHESELETLQHEYGGGAIVLPHGESLPGLPFEVILRHTPGHTEGSASYLMGSRLFTGDTLMTGGRGRHGRWQGAADAMQQSLEALSDLPGRLTIHPGHDEGPQASALLSEVLARIPR